MANYCHKIICFRPKKKKKVLEILSHHLITHLVTSGWKAHTCESIPFSINSEQYTCRPFLRLWFFQRFSQKIPSLVYSVITGVSVQFSCSVVSDSLRLHESQHARPPCPSPTPGVHSDSSPSSRWCHPAVSSSVVPFFSCPQSLPASKSFPMSQLFTWGGQSTRVSASASFHPKKSEDWFPLGWTGWISLQSKGLSRVFSVQKHQLFGTQLPGSSPGGSREFEAGTKSESREGLFN